MVIVKSLLVLVSLFFQLKVALPPHVPAKEQVRERGGSENAMQAAGKLAQVLPCAWATFQILILLALSDYCPPGLARLIYPLIPVSVTSDPVIFTAVTPVFLTGIVVTLAASFLRLYCFRTLGHHFTFQLAIRSSHKLVTEGLYGVVRHPSYTGSLLGCVGYVFFMFDLRPWVAYMWGTSLPVWVSSTHALETSILTGMSVTWLASTFIVMSNRMDREDAMLEKNFGDEWRVWAARVPYKIVPGVY